MTTAKKDTAPRRPRPQDFGHRYPITCDGTTLVVRRALIHLPPDVADAIRTWLHDHGLHENDVVIGRPITRTNGQVAYWGRPDPATEAAVVRVKAPPRTPRGTWPAPFPDVLLEQPRPDTCPTCGHTPTTEGA